MSDMVFSRLKRRVMGVFWISVLFAGLVESVIPASSHANDRGHCRGGGIDVEVCVVPGLRTGTFLVRDGSDGTVVASVPSDPASCPDQVFDVTLDYPATKPDPSIERERQTAPLLSIDASTSTCANAASSRVLRLERSEVHYGLGPSDLAEAMYVPSTASLGSLEITGKDEVGDSGLAFVRPKVAVDSLTRFEGKASTVVGKPCARARQRATCRARYAKALANPVSYGRATCGRCPLSPLPLSLLYTRGDEVRYVTDLRSFLGSIDTAADAALLNKAEVIAILEDGAWLVKRSEIDGTCDPFERADIYERVLSDGRIERVARLLVSRQFGVCA